MNSPVTGADTALWVAWHRTIETRRSDALFRDPLAARMAGHRGEEVARTMNRGNAVRGAWTTIARTCSIDRLLEQSIEQGVDCIVNLAAGYDTRPYRLPLPAELRWVEVDSAAVLDRKTDLLQGERPSCLLDRCPADLRDPEARSKVLAHALQGASSALVLTEGLLVYLPENTVRELASELLAHQVVRYWMTDLAAPLACRMMQKLSHLVSEDALWRFAPEQGADFFEPLGWRPTEVVSMLREAKRIKRLPLLLHLVVPFERNPRRPFGAVLRCERR